MHDKRLNILITGGTGSLGTCLVSRWYGRYNLTVLSRNPHRQAALARRFPETRFILTDICAEGEVRRACAGQDILVHAAALKQLDVGEYHPAEFARVNVLGTITVANAWAESRYKPHPLTLEPAMEPRLALLISSDKAVSALNAYGASKKLAEAIFRKMGFSVLRYGNVVESRGAFLERWRETLQASQPLEIRNPEPTRFFLTLDGAVDLVENVIGLVKDEGRDNGVFIPRNLAGFSIWDVAWTLSEETVMAPLLPYEKQHEALVAPGEVPRPETPLLCRIEPGWETDQNVLEYVSNSASRMGGPDFLEEIGWPSK